MVYFNHQFCKKKNNKIILDICSGFINGFTAQTHINSWNK